MMLTEMQQEWLRDFASSINKPGWVAGFVMMGPDDPRVAVAALPDCFPNTDNAREYNRSVLKIINDAGKLKKLRATLKGDLKTNHKSIPDCGRIAAKDWCKLVLDNLLGDEPNKNWV
jgi:hypothetical protein